MRIITVGNKSDPATISLLAEYEKRLKNQFRLEFTQLKPNPGSELETRNKDSVSITEATRPDEFLILLDERGENMTSEKFTKLVSDKPRATFIIGGAYGVSEELRKSADKVIRLSDMVLPHRLALLVLVEQIYRAQCITTGHPYHHSN